MNTLMRLIVIDLVVILRGMWARYSGNGCIHACAYKFGGGAGISRVFAVLVIRQNDLPPIYDWCARATFYRTLLSVQGINTPFLFYIRDMDKLGIKLNNFKNIFV